MIDNAKVISVFDGMACAMLAFQAAGIKVDRYVAFEIDKYAVQTSSHNFPMIEHRGDVFQADFTEFFGFDFNLVLKLSGKNGFEEKKKYTSQMCKDPSRWAEYFKAVNYHAVNCMRKNADKKNFIYNHSKKLEIAQLIIANRPESKIITFSNNIRMASAIGGPVYSSKETKKKGRITLAEFEKLDKGVINTAKKLVAGADIPLVNCEIILGQDSSKTRAVQTRGRALRKEGDKTSEIFNIVINDTQETKWFNSSHEGSPYITIDEENLIKVLNGEPFDTYKKPISKFNFRF